MSFHEAQTITIQSMFWCERR